VIVDQLKASRSASEEGSPEKDGAAMSANSNKSAEPDFFNRAPELKRWIEKTAGEVVRAKRLVGGNRREAWAVDVTVNGRVKELFLRYDPIDPKVTGDIFCDFSRGEFCRVRIHSSSSGSNRSDLGEFL
jgi:hypothetical protein